MHLVEGCKKSTMGGWNSRKRAKAGKGSHTPGKTKGPHCQATGPDRIYATRNRSYKYPGYDGWCERKRG